ncbi:MAG: tetraacyldisaccharide 4'-kinase [Pseudomonadota bacterium]
MKFFNQSEIRNPKSEIGTALNLPFLWPLGCLYGLGMRVRSELYERSIFKRATLPCRVISLGNLTLGGSGKTPATIWLSGYIRDRGKRVCIVSRGYKAQQTQSVGIVSDGRKLLLSPAAAGDEPFMMAKALPGIPVLTGKKRFDAGMRAIQAFQSEIIILDDAYQHLALNRDLNIVLLRTGRPFGNGYVFPAGILREPLSALKRADAFVLTYAQEESASETERQREFLERRFPGKPVFISHCRPTGFFYCGDQGQYDFAELKGRKALAFCGIANPESFRSTLAGSGLELVDFRAYQDHYGFQEQDLLDLEKRALACGAEIMITTEKDAVKISMYDERKLPTAALKTEFTFEPVFEEFISKHLEDL